MEELLKEIEEILKFRDPNCVKAILIYRRVKRYIDSIQN